MLVNPAMQVVLRFPGSATPKNPQPTKKCTTRIHALGSDDATSLKTQKQKKKMKKIKYTANKTNTLWFIHCMSVSVNKDKCSS